MVAWNWPTSLRHAAQDQEFARSVPELKTVLSSYGCAPKSRFRIGIQVSGATRPPCSSPWQSAS